jgi:threonyl-tRNA synthetase
MKFLALHCDYIKFKPLKKALRNPEVLSEERKELIEVKDPLVILTAVEARDENNPNLIENYVSEVLKIAEQVKPSSIVLYPYAHLSSSLSRPDFAQKVLQQAQEVINDYETHRAHFGYYKEFELKCKGHPLSELSREISHEGEETEIKEENLKEKKEIKTDEKYDPKQLLREVSKSKLDSRELKDNDHRILAKQMDLFSFSEVAPGMVFWHNKGLFIKNKLIEYWREEHQLAGYEEISTPQIMDSKLWKISGHWDKYKENNFVTDYEGRPFLVKPMNCPGGMLVYKNSPKTYKDLPLKVGELGVVHRQELSGVISGLFRVIQITQDDAHIFCTEEQLEEEIMNIIKLIKKVFKTFNLKFDHVELSTRPEKRIGSDENWDKAEKALEDVLKKTKMKYKLNPGDGAFYGPKIDFHLKDSLKRTWQCSTIQLDFSMPERFDLEYVDKDGKNKRPIMLHRVVYGSLERFLGIILEHFNGRLPLWLAPTQARVINFTDKNNKACEKLHKSLLEHGIRADIDLESSPIGGKIKQAEMEKIPYILVIGDREEKAKKIAIRHKGKVHQASEKTLLTNLKKEISEKEVS